MAFTAKRQCRGPFYADPASIVVDVINAVRNGAFQLGINEVMDLTSSGVPLASIRGPHS